MERCLGLWQAIFVSPCGCCRLLTPSLPNAPLASRFPQDTTVDVARKKKRSIKTNNRSLVGASLEVGVRKLTGKKPHASFACVTQP